MQAATERSLQGMTDVQFQAYQKSLLRHLERILKNMTDGEAKDELLIIIDDLRDSLSKP